MADSHNVTFIRKHGRIIPIHKKVGEGYHNIMKGRAKYEFTSAAGVALGGGLAARFMRHNALTKLAVAERAYKIKARALSHGDLDRAVKLSKLVNSATKGSMGATKIATGLRVGTFALTSALVSSGIQSLLAPRVKNPSEKTEFALTAGSILTGTALTGVAGKYGTREKLKLGYNIIKKLAFRK